MQITVHFVSWLTFFIISSIITKDYSEQVLSKDILGGDLQLEVGLNNKLGFDRQTFGRRQITWPHYLGFRTLNIDPGAHERIYISNRSIVRCGMKC